MAMAGAYAEPVEEQLAAYDQHVRRVCVESLATNLTVAVQHVAEVARLLTGDEAPDVRRAAAVTIGKVGTAAQGAILALLQALRDDSPPVRTAAAKAVGDVLGQGAASSTRTSGAAASSAAQAKKALEHLVSLTADREEEVQLAAVETIALLGDATELDVCFDSRFVSVCRTAVVEVGRSPAARARHAGRIAALLCHRETSVRLAAVHALGEVGRGCSAAHVAQLGATCVSERNPKVRQGGIQALGRVGPGGADELLRFLHDDDERVRHLAAETLGSVGGACAAEGCAQLLQAGRAEVQQAALLALGRMGAEGAVHSAAIAAVLQDVDLCTKLAALQALGVLGAGDYAAEVASLASDASKGARLAAVNALAKLGAAGAALAPAFLEDADPGVRQAAVRVFSPLHSQLPAEVARPYAKTVAMCLLDVDWRVRLAAAVALGDLRATEFTEQVAALNGDEDHQVRRSAVNALSKLRAGAVHFAAFLGDADSGVQAEARAGYDESGGGCPAGDSDLSEVE